MYILNCIYMYVDVDDLNSVKHPLGLCNYLRLLNRIPHELTSKQQTLLTRFCLTRTCCWGRVYWEVRLRHDCWDSFFNRILSRTGSKLRMVFFIIRLNAELLVWWCDVIANESFGRGVESGIVRRFFGTNSWTHRDIICCIFCLFCYVIFRITVKAAWSVGQYIKLLVFASKIIHMPYVWSDSWAPAEIFQRGAEIINT